MQRSLRRITSAFCRRFAVSFFFTSVRRMVCMPGARGILLIVGRRYRNFLLPDCDRSPFPASPLSLSLSRVLRDKQSVFVVVNVILITPRKDRWTLRATFTLTCTYFVSLWNFRQRDSFFNCIRRIPSVLLTGNVVRNFAYTRCVPDRAENIRGIL